MSEHSTDILIAAALFAAIFGCVEAGFRAGRFAEARADGKAPGQVGAIQGAVLGMLALLLAFTFSAAASRFLERQDLVVEEANAIGTAYLRADLLPEPHRAALRESLKGYTAERIVASARLATHGLQPETLAAVERRHAEMWRAASAGVAERPSATLAVLDPVNSVIDLHSTRLAAGRKRLPLVIVGILVFASMVAVAEIGYGCGMGGRRRAHLTFPFAALIAALLCLTIDLDRARSGMLRLSDAPLRALRFDESPAATPVQPAPAQIRNEPPGSPAPAR